MKNFTESVNSTLEYFQQFHYPPTIEEIYIFLNVKIDYKFFLKNIYKLEKEKVIVILDKRVYVEINENKNYLKRYKYSNDLLEKSNNYLLLLKYVPTVKLLGISGSLSMKNGAVGSDIDLFIITSNNCIWLTRSIILLYKKILSLTQPYIGNRLCFNIIFASNGLALPNFKRSEYTAHEILQLKVLINKECMYENFLQANNWVLQYYPNVQIKLENIQSFVSSLNQSKCLVFVEKYIGKMQKKWLRIKKYDWTEREGQLWLIQEDFESKIRKHRKE